MQAFPILREDLSPRDHFQVLHRIDIDHRTGTPNVLVQSSKEPNWSFIEKEYNGYLKQIPSIKEPQYQQLQQGQTLRFCLRANPTKKIDTKTGPDGKRKNGRRVPLRTEGEQVQWLQRKGEQHGFRLIHVRVGQSSETPVLDMRIKKEIAEKVVKGSKKDNQLTLHSVFFEGHLQIINLEKFNKTLVDGIGSAKAYGFGLLSIMKA
jgi:CRISPR system Cascade subunit CasE